MEVASRIESGIPRPFPPLLYNSEKIKKTIGGFNYEESIFRRFT